MADHSLADFVLFLNQQIDVQRQIAAPLWGLDALLTVCLVTISFYNLSKNNLHHCFSGVSDLFREIIGINQTILSHLMKQPQ